MKRMKRVGTKQDASQLLAHSSEASRAESLKPSLPPPTGFGMFAERFKDLPADYWSDPKYNEEFVNIFPEYQE